MKNIFPILAAVLLLASCSSGATDTADNQLTQLQAELAQQQSEFDSLKAKFDYQVDEFSGSGVYFHKDWPADRVGHNTLLAYVRDAGTMTMTTTFHGPKWLHHESVSVKIGDKVLESGTVALNDKMNQREVAGARVYEDLHYTQERDNGILKEIASTNEPVLVRLHGRQRNEDFTLPAEHHQILRDCVRLAELIRTLPGKEAQVKRLELGL